MGCYWVVEFEDTKIGENAKHTLAGSPNGTPFCNGILHHCTKNKNKWVCWTFGNYISEDEVKRNIVLTHPNGKKYETLTTNFEYGIKSITKTNVTEQIDLNEEEQNAAKKKDFVGFDSRCFNLFKKYL